MGLAPKRTSLAPPSPWRGISLIGIAVGPEVPLGSDPTSLLGAGAAGRIAHSQIAKPLSPDPLHAVNLWCRGQRGSVDLGFAAGRLTAAHLSCVSLTLPPPGGG